MTSTTPVTDHWHELVTVSLLGTDRREPPPPPDGPLADVVDDALAPSPSGRMLAHVAATTVARRAGIRPGPSVASLTAPEPDARPMIPAAAARRWRAIVRDWAVLEDEWLATVERRGWRLSPDVLVGMLRRHRNDAGRWARVSRAGGPLVDWLTQHQPQLARPGGTRRAAATDAAAGLDELPGLAVPPELLALLTAGPDRVTAAVAHGFASAAFTIAHRNVLVNFVARCRTDALGPLAEGLRRLDPSLPSGGLAHSLADLAQARQRMLQELERT